MMHLHCHSMKWYLYNTIFKYDLSLDFCLHKFVSSNKTKIDLLFSSHIMYMYVTTHFPIFS